MRKTSKKGSKRKVLDKGQMPSRPGAVRRVRIKEVLIGARSRLREVVMSSGIQVLMAMLEEDREEFCAALGTNPRRTENTIATDTTSLPLFWEAVRYRS